MRIEIDREPDLYHARFIRYKDFFATTAPNVNAQDFIYLASEMKVLAKILAHDFVLSEDWDAGSIHVSNYNIKISLIGGSSQLKIPVTKIARLKTAKVTMMLAPGIRYCLLLMRVRFFSLLIKVLDPFQF